MNKKIELFFFSSFICQFRLFKILKMSKLYRLVQEIQETQQTQQTQQLSVISNITTLIVLWGCTLLPFVAFVIIVYCIPLKNQ